MSLTAPTPVVLALDTSTSVLTAAVGRTGEVQGRNVEAGRHTGALVPAVVAEVMAQAQCAPTDLTAVAVGVGPGPYTSLRAGIMFAEAAAAALAIPVIGACSLDITARTHAGLRRHTPSAVVDPDPPAPAAAGDFVVAADARRRELYWARYTRTGIRLAGPQVDPRAELEERWAQEGVEVITAPPSAAELAHWVLTEFLQHGGAAPALADTTRDWVAPTRDAAELEIPQTLLVARPLYLRRPDAVAPVSPPPATGKPA